MIIIVIIFWQRMKVIRKLLQSRVSHFSKSSVLMSNMSLDAGKNAAAIEAVNKFVINNQKIGVGSGSTIVFAVKRLAERVAAENLKVKCVPTSFQAKQLILENNLPLSDIEQTPEVTIIQLIHFVF